MNNTTEQVDREDRCPAFTAPNSLHVDYSAAGQVFTAPGVRLRCVCKLPIFHVGTHACACGSAFMSGMVLLGSGK